MLKPETELTQDFIPDWIPVEEYAGPNGVHMQLWIKGRDRAYEGFKSGFGSDSWWHVTLYGCNHDEVTHVRSLPKGPT